jgi:hypothetical protein
VRGKKKRDIVVGGWVDDAEGGVMWWNGGGDMIRVRAMQFKVEVRWMRGKGKTWYSYQSL